MMNRLTERDEYGNADIVGVDSEDLQMNLGFDEFNKVTDALNKLAAYEETELTPKEIKLMKNREQWSPLMKITQIYGVNLDRIVELCEAEQALKGQAE